MRCLSRWVIFVSHCFIQCIFMSLFRKILPFIIGCSLSPSIKVSKSVKCKRTSLLYIGWLLSSMTSTISHNVSNTKVLNMAVICQKYPTHLMSPKEWQLSQLLAMLQYQKCATTLKSQTESFPMSIHPLSTSQG